MNSYALRFIISGCLIALLAFAGNAWMRAANLSVYHTFQKNDTLFNHQINANVLLLGSSRMYNTVNPRLLEDSLHVKVYNAGMPESNINEMLLVLKSYLEQNRNPQLVIAAIDGTTMNDRKQFGFYPTYLYNIDKPSVNHGLKVDGVHTDMHKLFPFFLSVEYDDYYRGATLKFLSGKKEIKEGDFTYHGYLSNTLDTISKESPMNLKPVFISASGLNKLEKLVSICQDRGVRVILLYAPEYNWHNMNNISNKNEFLEAYSATAAKHHIPFLRHDSLAMCQQKKYFANPGHVNRKGADVYSAILASQLLKLCPKLFSEKKPLATAH